jgi:dTDP-4-amino-4,6-dideoxygalactose transaminase
MNVPFVDLHAQYLRYKVEFDAAISKVIEESAFISGHYAREFETNFSEYARIRHTVSCANGTDSLEILLDVLGIGPGDEVIIPALSWISTAEVIGTRGAIPVFVDIDETYTINVELIEEKITHNTKCIIPVHLYGCPANMSRIVEIAQQYDLIVIEDCAQAHGAEWRGQRIATFGVASSFSFYPGKNLGAYGDAGAMVTNSEIIATKARMISNHGQPKKHEHLLEGRNSRMDGIQAAILNVKLRYIETWTEERISIANRYTELLKGLNVKTPIVPEGARHVFHLYVIQHDDRDRIFHRLLDGGIECAIHYPTPLPLMPCYAHFGYTGADFPVASKICSRILSLPIYPELTTSQIDRVVEIINSYV